MVSNASEDFPEPLTPVTIVSALCGISKLIFLRLWTRTPRTTMLSVPVRFAAVAINQPLYNGRDWVISLSGKVFDVFRRDAQLTHLAGFAQILDGHIVDFED